MSLSVIVLAAGQGTRMRSSLPKVLHPLAGKPLLQHVTECAARLDPARTVVVYGHGGERVREQVDVPGAAWVHQAERLGTGHAVEHAMPEVEDGDTVLVLYGDVPLIEAETLRRLLAAGQADALALLTVELAAPHGYGRIVRDAAGRVQRIVEQKDASAGEQAIREINTGVLAAPAARLRGWLQALDNDNAQGEFYLTDVVALAVRDGVPVVTAQPASVEEVQGVNDRLQLAALERHYQRLQAERLMRDGLALLDPARFDLRGELSVGRDCELDVNVVIEGRVVLGDGVRVGANCLLRDVSVGAGSEILPMSVLERAEIGPACHVGPFARIRPGTRLAEGARVGNFVELKQAEVGAGSKINHLSYVGDASVGAEVNIGAGTITCNYDGANKHHTTIGDGAFIGSDSQLVAPVEVGAGATIGAGSTITRDAPAGELTVSRAKQTTINGWKRPVKAKRD